METLATPDEVAEYLQVTTTALRDWRYRRAGPRYVRVGGHVRYRWPDVRQWCEENAVDTAP